MSPNTKKEYLFKKLGSIEAQKSSLKIYLEKGIITQGEYEIETQNLDKEKEELEQDLLNLEDH